MRANQDILLCDLDAFFASVEQLDRPRLKGKPVIVGGDPRGRGVVSTCSYEARKYGVSSAMPLKKALELCPGAVFLPVNMVRYAEVSRKVGEIFKRFTPDIEFVSIDEAYLGVSKGAGCYTGEAVRSAVRQELHLPISVGVSANKLLAKIACELAKPDNLGTLWPEEVKELLWPLSVKVIPGIGPKTEQKLRSYGINKVRDLAQYPTGALLKIIGSNGITLQEYACGIDGRAIESRHESKSISEEITFPEDLKDKSSVIAAIQELSAGVGYRLRRAGFQARTISIKLRFQDFSTITRSKTLIEAVNSDGAIYRTARSLFIKHCGKPPWRLMGVKASGFERGTQLSIFSYSPEEDKERKILEAKDLLQDKYGFGIVKNVGEIANKKDGDTR